MFAYFFTPIVAVSGGVLLAKGPPSFRLISNLNCPCPKDFAARLYVYCPSLYLKYRLVVTALVEADISFRDHWLLE